MTDYNAYCAAVGVKPKKIVEVVSGEFPKFSKIQFSMCANPAYGVCLRPEAEDLLTEAFGEGPGLTVHRAVVKKKDNRKKANCFRVRLDDETAHRVRVLMAEMNFGTVQEFLEKILLAMLDSRKEKTA